MRKSTVPTETIGTCDRILSPCRRSRHRRSDSRPLSASLRAKEMASRAASTGRPSQPREPVFVDQPLPERGFERDEELLDSSAAQNLPEDARNRRNPEGVGRRPVIPVFDARAPVVRVRVPVTPDPDVDLRLVGDGPQAHVPRSADAGQRAAVRRGGAHGGTRVGPRVHTAAQAEQRAVSEVSRDLET